MSDVMGICGATPHDVACVLDRMRDHMRRWACLRCESWSKHGFGLLQFSPDTRQGLPKRLAEEHGTVAAMAGELLGQRTVARQGDIRPQGAVAESDIEFVLTLYRQQGWRALRHLNGTFALVFHEPGGRLVLATDRQVSYPLFYRRFETGFMFSTRFNALLTAGGGRSAELDIAAVMEFMTLQDVQLDLTFVRQVRALPAGSVLTWEGGEPLIRRYRQVGHGREAGSLQECAEALAGALRCAASRQSRGIERGGVFLSGGLDSRLTAAALDRPMTAFTVGDWCGPEVRTARRVARSRGWPHVFLQRQADHYARILAKAVDLTGGMQRFDHCHFLGHMDRVRRECRVAFVEEPMDVLFKGHYWHRRLNFRGIKIPIPGAQPLGEKDLVAMLLRLDVKSTFPSFPWKLFREPWRSGYWSIMRHTLGRLIADAPGRDSRVVLEHAAGRGSYGRTSSFANLACLRPYLNARALCLDNEVLDVSLNTPPRYRTDDRLVVLALRRLAPELAAMPLARSGLRPDTPDWLAWLAQMGAETAFRARKACGAVPAGYTRESWPDRGELLRAGALHHILESTLTDQESFPDELFDRSYLRRLYVEHKARQKDHRWLLLCLLTFGTWFRRYGPASLAAPDASASFVF